MPRLGTIEALACQRGRAAGFASSSSSSRCSWRRQTAQSRPTRPCWVPGRPGSHRRRCPCCDSTSAFGATRIRSVPTGWPCCSRSAGRSGAEGRARPWNSSATTSTPSPHTRSTPWSGWRSCRDPPRPHLLAARHPPRPVRAPRPGGRRGVAGVTAPDGRRRGARVLRRRAAGGARSAVGDGGGDGGPGAGRPPGERRSRAGGAASDPPARPLQRQRRPELGRAQPPGQSGQGQRLHPGRVARVGPRRCRIERGPDAFGAGGEGAGRAPSGDSASGDHRLLRSSAIALRGAPGVASGAPRGGPGAPFAGPGAERYPRRPDGGPLEPLPAAPPRARHHARRRRRTGVPA